MAKVNPGEFIQQVRRETAKVTCIILTKFAAVLFSGASVFAVLRLTFGG